MVQSLRMGVFSSGLMAGPTTNLTFTPVTLALMNSLRVRLTDGAQLFVAPVYEN